jgi:hypothetical protein
MGGEWLEQMGLYNSFIYTGIAENQARLTIKKFNIEIFIHGTFEMFLDS